MPYHIVKRSGAKPYKIVRNADGKVVGSSKTKAQAGRSIGYRMESEPSKRSKDFKRKVDNKARGVYGDTDLKKKIIRINKKAHKKTGEKIIDTIRHEENHRLHPKMHEKNIRKKTKADLTKMSKKEKQKHYSRFK